MWVRPRRRNAPWLCLAGLLAASLAACGSQVTPDAHRLANSSVTQVGSSGASSDGGTGIGPGGSSGALGHGSAGGPGGGIPAGNGRSHAQHHGTRGPDGDDPKPASCAGFENQTGITSDAITIANVADVTGPIPGVFQSAQEATRAYVAYFNATHPDGICGRKLQLLELDSRTDATADQQAYQKACESAFAAIGSMSAFDSGGAGTAEQCGLPDIRASAVTPERVACTTCFGAQSLKVDEVDNATPRYFVARYPQATQHAAFLWLDADAATANAQSFMKAWEKNGFTFVYTAAIDVAEFNYTPYVQKMRDKGVRSVSFLGPYQDTVRLAQAMKQQGFKPELFVQDSTIYDQDFVDSGGSAIDGFWTYLNITPFNATGNKEMSTYLEWLHEISPDSSPTFFGVFAWSATKLFVEQSLALGGELNRESLVASVKKVDDWTADGIHAPQHVGSKTTGECWRMFQLHDGHWVNESGKKYLCQGITHT